MFQHLCVSILVFVEVALGPWKLNQRLSLNGVSILVFVEVALGLFPVKTAASGVAVSILVFVEVALGQGLFFALFGVSQC